MIKISAFNYFQQQFKLADYVPLGSYFLLQDSFPKHQLMLWSMYHLTPRLNFDLNWRFVDNIQVESHPVTAYQEFDAHSAWNVSQGFEVALVCRNLLNKQHSKFGNFIDSVPTAVQREVYATIRWSF